MSVVRTLGRAFVGLALALAVWAGLAYVPPAKGFLYPEGARIIVFHVPCAWITFLAYVVAAVYAVRTLRGLAASDRTRWEHADAGCNAAMEIGLVFGILTTVSGSIFSRLQWGAFWSWDPRQTSILVILLMFCAYLVLRGAVVEPSRRARLSAAYAIVAIVPAVFLIWVLPRIAATLHADANQAVIGGGLDRHYRLAMYAVALPGFLGLFAWLQNVRMRLARVETLVQDIDETTME